MYIPFSLSGVYLMVMAYVATLVRFAISGPLTTYLKAQVEVCKTDMWRNLLYFNNYEFESPSGTGVSMRVIQYKPFHIALGMISEKCK